jgi:hypothetical protein
MARGGLLVARGDAAEPLEPVVQPPDPVPRPARLAVGRGRLLAGRVRGDDRQDAPDQQPLPDPVGVVARVADRIRRRAPGAMSSTKASNARASRVRPGVGTIASGRPSPSRRGCGLVDKPPRERPSA